MCLNIYVGVCIYIYMHAHVHTYIHSNSPFAASPSLRVCGPTRPLRDSQRAPCAVHVVCVLSG